MLELLNCAIYSPEYSVSATDIQIEKLARKHKLDGFEISRYDGWNENRPLPAGVKGVHIQFLPIWLDFWRENEEELLRQFGNQESYIQYYGSPDREILVQKCRAELLGAEKLGAEYVVFHVCHMELAHCYTYQFTYSDMEVAEAFIDFLNEVLSGLNLTFEILFENTWWPGLKLLDNCIPDALMEKINYSPKGFMIDIGHMMNSNLNLKTEKEAVAWIEAILSNLGKNRSLIHGIHLHSSLSGCYVSNSIKTEWIPSENKTFFEQYINSFEHISQIDQHLPFCDPSIKRIIDIIQPKYLVHEFTVSSISVLDEYLKLQRFTLLGTPYD